MTDRKAALQRLDRLVGSWTIEIVMPTDPPMTFQGRDSLEWLTGNYFLANRSEVDESNFPKVEAIIGCDDAMETYHMLYSDSRGIARLYSMSLTDTLWTLWRDDPSFRQRYVGTISTDGNTITGYWEQSVDGSNWTLDFHLNYTRA